MINNEKVQIRNTDRLKDLYNSYCIQCEMNSKDPISFEEWSNKADASNEEITDESFIPSQFLCPFDFVKMATNKTISVTHLANIAGVTESTIRSNRNVYFGSLRNDRIEIDEAIEYIEKKAHLVYIKYARYCLKNNLVPKDFTGWKNRDPQQEENIPDEYVKIDEAAEILNIGEQSIQRYIESKWLNTHSNTALLVEKSSVLKYRDREKPENLLYCERCSKRMPFTKFDISKHENTCNNCSWKIGIFDQAAEKVQQDISKSVFSGYLCTTVGFIKETYIKRIYAKNGKITIQADSDTDDIYLATLDCVAIEFNKPDYEINSKIVTLLGHIKQNRSVAVVM